MRYFHFFVISLIFLVFPGGIVQAQVNEKTLEDLISLKTDMTKKNELEHRYVIQLGSYSQMNEAVDVLENFKEKYPDVLGRLEYESPNYKAWVGSFTSRLSAERMYAELKKEFRSAFVFRPH